MSLLHKAVEVTEKIEGMSGAAEALQKFIDADNTLDQTAAAITGSGLEIKHF